MQFGLPLISGILATTGLVMIGYICVRLVISAYHAYEDYQDPDFEPDSESDDESEWDDVPIKRWDLNGMKEDPAEKVRVANVNGKELRFLKQRRKVKIADLSDEEALRLESIHNDLRKKGMDTVGS